MKIDTTHFTTPEEFGDAIIGIPLPTPPSINWYNYDSERAKYEDAIAEIGVAIAKVNADFRDFCIKETLPSQLPEKQKLDIYENIYEKFLDLGHEGVFEEMKEVAKLHSGVKSK